MNPVITADCPLDAIELQELGSNVCYLSAPLDNPYTGLEDPMSLEVSTSEVGILKENLSNQVNLETKGTTHISVENTARVTDTFADQIPKLSKQRKNEEPINLMPPPKSTSNFLDKFYKHSCPTCKIHFPTEKGYERHILESQAHKPFKLSSSRAERLGYYSASGTKAEISNLVHNHRQYLVRRIPRTRAPAPCTKPDCTCPQFEFVFPEKPKFASSMGGLSDYLCLDGIAGSIMYGEARDEEEEDTLTFSSKRPHPPSDEDEGPYVRLPDSDDEEEMAQYRAFEEQKLRDEAAAAIAAAEAERQRKIQDEIDLRKRFSKGKKRKASRLAQYETDRAVYEAYIAADETLFGQQRFEEVAEEEEKGGGVIIPPQALIPDAVIWTKEDCEAAVASWQKDMGQTDYNVEAKRFERELSEQIDSLIMDTLFEVNLRQDEEKRDKASVQHKNKLFFEDTLEDIAIDHEFNIEDKYQERHRKKVGKEQTKQLNNLRMDDMVDDVAMDHSQEVCERGAEKYRTTVGKKQTKGLNLLRMEDIVDDIAMDHSQEVGEREEERYRRIAGKFQNKELNDLRMGDLVENLAMDHIQEVCEKEEEHRRRNTGRIQNKELTRLKMDDVVDDFVMDHSQEIGERREEYYRKTEGKIQSKKIADLEMDDIVGDLAMVHNQEVEERAREHQRKTLGHIQAKKLTGMRMEEEDIFDSIVMDHFQEVSEKLRERQRNITGIKQSKKLATLKDDTLVDTLVMDYIQDVAENEQERYRSITGRQQSRDLAINNMDHIVENLALNHLKNVEDRELEHQKRAVSRKKNRETAAREMDKTVEHLTKCYSQDKAVAEKKSEAFLTRFLPSNDDGGVKIGEETCIRPYSGKGEEGEEWYEQEGGVKLPKDSKTIGTFSTKHKAQEPAAENTPKHDEYDEYDDGYTSPVPVPKKTIKQKRKEAQAKYDAIIEEMARAQKH